MSRPHGVPNVHGEMTKVIARIENQERRIREVPDDDFVIFRQKIVTPPDGIFVTAQDVSIPFEPVTFIGEPHPSFMGLRVGSGGSSFTTGVELKSWVHDGPYYVGAVVRVFYVAAVFYVQFAGVAA